MEILYVKLTWFSAEWSRLVILVLYFTLICGVTSDVPRWISANIQMKAPPQCLSLSLLIVELQVGVPEWQLNYSQCVYTGVYVFWAFGGCFFFFFAECFRAAHWSEMLWIHHTVDFENGIVSRITTFTASQVLLLAKLDKKKGLKEVCLPIWCNSTKQTSSYWITSSIVTTVSIKYCVIEIWIALNLCSLCQRLFGSLCVGWLHLAQQYAKMFKVGLTYFSCQHSVQ